MEKQFLKDNNIEYEYADVDLCSEDDREKIRQDILNMGGRLSYPVIIIDGKILINGFYEEKIKEALGI
jgi:glutaredoxin